MLCWLPAVVFYEAISHRKGAILWSLCSRRKSKSTNSTGLTRFVAPMSFSSTHWKQNAWKQDPWNFHWTGTNRACHPEHTSAKLHIRVSFVYFRFRSMQQLMRSTLVRHDVLEAVAFW